MTVASDVDNPLLGERGAAAVYGPQKGASPEQVAELDAALAHWARTSSRRSPAATTGTTREPVPRAASASAP